MNRRWGRPVALALLLGAVALTAAAGEKVLRYAFEIAETGFDPAQISDTYSRNIAANLFDAPLRYAWLAPAGTLEPNTAAALPEITPDFRSFTFTLKPGIYFADDPAFDGRRRELVAADYVYSIKRIADPRWKSPSWGGFEEAAVVGLGAARDQATKSGHFDYDREIEGLRVLDRYRFRVTLERSSPHFADTMADPSVVGAVAREVVEHYGDRIMDHPVGTGPYRLDIWRRSSRIELVRNPTYREEYFPARAPAGDADARALVDQLHGRRLPIVDRFVISPIEESQPRWLAFLNGEHDLVERMPRDLTPLALAGKAMTPVLARKHVQLYRVPEIDVTIIIYNMDDPVVGGYTPVQVALRRALSLSVDVDGLIAGIYKYQAFPAQTVVMPGTYGFDPARHTENGDYDPGRANALLDIYGYRRGADGWRSRPDGSPLEVEMSTEPDQRSRLMNEIIKKSYNAIGVQVRFKIAKWPENLKMVQESQYQIWFLGLTASGPDSIPSLRQMYGPALGGDDLCRMKLPEFDRLLLSADELPDGPARLALVDRMTALEVAYAPLKAVTHRYKIALAYPWVIGYRARPFIHDWWRYIDVDVDLQARHSR